MQDVIHRTAMSERERFDNVLASDTERKSFSQSTKISKLFHTYFAILAGYTSRYGSFLHNLSTSVCEKSNLLIEEPTHNCCMSAIPMQLVEVQRADQ